MPDPLVFLPGLQSTHTSWLCQIGHFSDRHEVIVPQGYHVAGSIAEMASRVMDQLPDRFHLIAWSMGGYITFEMLPHIQERIVSLTLVSTSARAEDPANAPRRAENIALAQASGMGAQNDHSLAFSCVDADGLDQSLRTRLRQSAETLGVAAYQAQVSAIQARKDHVGNLCFVTCPTLVIVGRHDPVTPPDCAIEIAGGIPGAKLEIIENCGHCAPIEQPEIFNRLLADWLAKATPNQMES